MDRVLELLMDESPSSLRAAAKLLTVDVLASSKEPSKHKLKTKISSLLKSSGSKRAYGAVLARLALRDWSIVKSHGGSWVVIMLHTLDLPDRVCWKPVTRTLADLFVSVQGKPDLVREVGGGSKIADFLKRLVTTLPVTRLYAAAAQMLQSYPTQSRPYINKLLPVLHGRAAAEAIASTCVSEKQSVDIWQTRVTDLMAKIEASFEDELALENHIELLASHIQISPRIRAKVPAHRLTALLLKMLGALKPTVARLACSFICETAPLLAPFYIQLFDEIVYRAAECMELGLRPAIEAVRVVHMLVSRLGWVSEKYAQLFIRLQKRVLRMLDSRDTALGAEGLADYVQNPAAFAVASLTGAEIHTLVSYLTCVVVNVPGIPQSLRVQTDQVILQLGQPGDIVQATLYPAKYSILPLAIEQIPTLTGFQALVHPRFPPLTKSKATLSSWPKPEAEDEPEIALAQPAQEPVVEAAAEEPEAADHSDEPQVEAPLPAIPESHQPKRPSETSAVTPPEKKPKVEATQAVEAAQGVEAAQAVEAEEADDDEELEIPTLNMDSD